MLLCKKRKWRGFKIRLIGYEEGCNDNAMTTQRALIGSSVVIRSGQLVLSFCPRRGALYILKGGEKEPLSVFCESQ